jgi:hypothetical protein
MSFAFRLPVRPIHEKHPLMPAIQPARMKIQVARLSEMTHQPERFVHELHGLLDFYADRTHRPGQFGEPPPLLASYKTPDPVMRQIEREIASLAEEPASALALVDALWAEAVLEFRLLAIRLLGRVPLRPPQAVLERARQWIASNPEDRLQSALLEHGLARLRQEAPSDFYPLVERWLNAKEISSRQAGLRALAYLASDPGFENVPALIRLVAPWVRATPAPLKQEMAGLMRALAARFPREASFLLKQNLAADRPDSIWLARQALPELPEEVQQGLREALRQYQR